MLPNNRRAIGKLRDLGFGPQRRGHGGCSEIKRPGVGPARCSLEGVEKTGARDFGFCEQREPLLLETSVPGVFAAGDLRAGAMNRVASAVGEGSMVVRLAHEYLALT